MAEQTASVGMQRKLAAIFSTDVAGYSRLMGADEVATLAKWVEAGCPGVTMNAPLFEGLADASAMVR